MSRIAAVALLIGLPVLLAASIDGAPPITPIMTATPAAAVAPATGPASPPAVAAATAVSPSSAPVVMRDNVAIPMRDGTILRAMIALPAGGTGRWPAVLTLTPYQRDGGWSKAQAFARAGYIFVAIDVRGRGDSGGEFVPFINEGRDGYDAVEWIAAQPFSNGRIGMWGSSYGGHNQWATAALRPPHLRSIQPAASALPGYDFPIMHNIMRPYAAYWLAYTSGRTGHSRFFEDLPYQTAAFERVIRSGRSQADLATELGFELPNYQSFLDHPTFDDWWRARSPAEAGYAAISIPSLTITGYWDGAQTAALEHWRRHRAVVDRPDQFLIVGPFDHAGTRFPQARVGGVTVPASGVIDMMALDLAWFDWTLRDGPKPTFLKGRVAYYQLGESDWRYASDLATAASGDTRLWLGDGTLSARPAVSRQAVYRDDPADLSRFRLGTWVAGDWLVYQDDVKALGNHGLVYLTAPLTEPLAIAGRPRVRLPLSIETPDADFRVRLYDVDPQGGSVLLAHDAMRARYRESLSRVSATVAGRRYLYDFDQMTWLASTIPVGHRLRLVVDTPDSVYDQHNFNAGGDVARETMRDARAGNVTLFEGGRDGATLDLPIHAAGRDAPRR